MRRAQRSWSDVRGCQPDRTERDRLGDGGRDRGQLKLVQRVHYPRVDDEVDSISSTQEELLIY